MNAHKAERIAQMLFETTLPGGRDEDVAKRHGYSVRQLKRLRAEERAGEHPLVTELFTAKRSVTKATIERAIEEHIGALTRAAQTADVKDPAVIHALAGAFKLLNEAQVTNRVLDARLSGAHSPARAADRPVVAGRSGADSAEERAVH